MATFHERVQDYIGEFEDVDAISIWLKEAVRKVMDYIPLPRAEKYTSSADITGAGLSVTDKRVIDVRVAGRSARKVSPSLANDLATNSLSLYEVTARDPAYYIADQKVYTVPTTSAKLHYLPYLDLLYTSETTSLPDELTEVITLDVCCRAKQRQMNDFIATSADDLVWSAPTFPTSPTIAEVIAAINTIVAPADIDPAVWATTGIVGVDVAPPVISIATLLAELATTIDSYKDIELAQIKIGQIQVWIQDYISKANIYMEEQKQETGILADARKTDAEFELQSLIQKATALLQTYSKQVDKYAADLNAEAARFSQVREYSNQRVQQFQTEYMVLKSRYDEALSLITGMKMQEAKQ